MRDHFKFRKENQLKKDDKSLKGSWDSRIIDLCEGINLKEEYYTTSSCSGRVVLLLDSREKRDDLFIFVSHDEISFEKLKEVLSGISGSEMIYFKCDPVILHVACQTLEDAQNLIDIAVRDAGWKRCSVIGTGKRFVVELNSTGKLEFPIYHNKILVDDDYLRLIVSEANKKLKSSWERIEKLHKSL
jgi:tRNA wybutosine-synthesizing protein 3